jgi:hypothetical protein
MAIVQISKIQQRRGLQQDLPTLSAGELGWSVDSRRLYIGNGSVDEGAPTEGKTEVLTEFSIVNFTAGFVSNIVAIEGNLVVVQSNISTLSNSIAALQAGTLSSTSALLYPSSSGTLTTTTANNGVISYTLVQGTKHRTGTISFSYNPAASSVNFNEEYSETATTDVVFSMNANTTQANLNYTTTTTTTVLYRTQSLS